MAGRFTDPFEGDFRFRFGCGTFDYYVRLRCGHTREEAAAGLQEAVDAIFRDKKAVCLRGLEFNPFLDGGC